jgi:hypothetical protein
MHTRFSSRCTYSKWRTFLLFVCFLDLLAQAALQEYRDDVVGKRFPSARYSPYRIPEAELQSLVDQLKKQGAHAAAQAVEETAHAESQQASSSESKG